MEHASAAQGMPLPKNLRPKQIEVITSFATENVVITKLPTGYGKTKAAAGSFAQLRYRGQCNRMLYAVPRRRQAYQAAEELPDALAEFNVESKALIVGKDQIRSLRAHSRGSILVYVVTVQSLLADRTWETILELMQTGRWFVVIDEHHHYANDGSEDGWTGKIRTLNHSALLAMSATPKRRDQADHFGDPTISETYKAAADAGYVKRLSLHAYHYTIDAVTIDGTVHQFSTESLAEAAGSESPDAIDAYMASRKMRFSPKYVSPLVTFPLDRLIDLRARGVRAQMLIQAMSCSHAQCIFDQVKALLPDGMTVDWVGTGPNGRSQDENDRVLNEQFCPPKNKLTKKRPWVLDILINVGMAGEGTDCIDPTEIVFLTPANVSTSNLQTIGRGSRPMIIAHGDQPTCHVNVDSGSDMASYIGARVMDLFDEDIDIPNTPDVDPPERKPSEYKELPERLGWMIADLRLVDIRSEPMFKAVYETTRNSDQVRSDEEIAAIAERACHEYMNRTGNQTAIHAQKMDQIEAAVSKIAGLIVRRMTANGMRIERTLVGDLKKRINGRKKHHMGSVKEADDAGLDAHWEWLKKLEQSILLEHGLNGVPSWLR
jgi:superfamily II DNA or RNA helicase